MREESNVQSNSEINYSCNYMQVFKKKYKYAVKTCMSTISAMYQIINLNVSPYLKTPHIKWDIRFFPL